MTRCPEHQGLILLAIVVLIGSFGIDARAEQEESWNVDLVGRWIGGPSQAVAVRDSIAYASVPGGIIVIDFTIPGAPVELGSVALAGDCPKGFPCERLALSGGHAYVTAGSAGLYIVDVTNSSAPRVAGYFDTDGHASDVDVKGGYAYVADFESGLRIFDVTDPAAPREVGSIPAAAQTYSVTVDGNHAYLADFSAGLRVVDVTDPAAPVEVGTYGDEARGVAVADGYAYVAVGRDGIRVLAVSDPSNPREVSALDTPIEAWDLEVRGDRLYVAEVRSLLVVDVSDPAAPTQLLELRSGSGLIYDVTLGGEWVYATVGDGGLRVLDLSDESGPQVIGRFTTGNFANRVGLKGDYAYVTGPGDGLKIIDVSDPSAPVLAGLYGPPVTDIEIVADYAYVSSGRNLLVLDVSQPLTPVAVGSYRTGTGFSILGIAIRDGLAYVANSFAGLRVLDLSDPSTPTEVSLLDTPGFATEVVVNGDYAYVADLWEGLRIINVSDPAEPFEESSYATDTDAVSVAVEDEFAYVSVDSGGLVVLDVSDPAAPVRVGAFTKGSAWTSQVVVRGHRVFLTYEPLGLRVLDVSDPANPVETGYYDASGRSVGVTVDDEHLYVAGARNGLYVLRYPAVRLAHLDIKPGSCPNPLNVRPYGMVPLGRGQPKGVLPAALLGEADFDVGDVDLSSLRLEGVAPLRHGYDDVSTVPADEGECPCAPDGPDGYVDLTLKFSRAAIAAAIAGQSGSVPLTVTGELRDGTPIEATDCVHVIGVPATPVSIPDRAFSLDEYAIGQIGDGPR